MDRRLSNQRGFTLPQILAAVLVVAVLAWLLSRRMPHDDGRVHVTYWEKWSGEEADAMQAVVDAFNHSQNKITVDYLSMSDIERKTLIATAGGHPPDVAGLWSFSTYSYVDRDALLPLDDFIAADGQTVPQWLERYYPVYGNAYSYRGKLWGLPSNAAVIAFYWNKDLFRQAGLDPDRPPKTVAELDAFSERLAKTDSSTGAYLQLGFLPQEPFPYTWIYPFWFGGQLWDGRKIMLQSCPENHVCYQWVEDFTKKYGLQALQMFTSGFGNIYSPQGAFFSRKLAMQVNGVWYHRSIQLYAPGLDYGVAAWPAAQPGVTDFCMAESDALVIPRGAEHPREAWEFIKYVNSSNPHAQSREELQGMELMCYLQQKNSPLRTWSPFFEQHHPNPNIKVFRELSSSPHAISFPKIGIWPEYNRELSVLFDKSRLMAQPVDDAIAYAQKRMTASWAQYRKSLARRGWKIDAAEGDKP